MGGEWPDLVYLTGEVGVGGVIFIGRLLAGADGFSGEVGHLALGDHARSAGADDGAAGRPPSASTPCCAAPADRRPGPDPDRDLETPRRDRTAQCESGDGAPCRPHRVGISLGVGGSRAHQRGQPRVVVLGGYFAVLGRFLMAPLHGELACAGLRPRTRRSPRRCPGWASPPAVRGGAVALESVFADPTLVPATSQHSPPARR